MSLKPEPPTHRRASMRRYPNPLTFVNGSARLVLCGEADDPARARARRVLPADAQGATPEDRTNERDPESARRPDPPADRALPPRRERAAVHLRLHRDL